MATPLELSRDAFEEFLGWTGRDAWVADFMFTISMSAKGIYNDEASIGCVTGGVSVGKTEGQRAFMDLPGFSISFNDGTKASLISGSFSVQRSLLHNIDRRVCINTDGTNLLPKDRDRSKWDQHFGILRTVYDNMHAFNSGAMNEDCRIRSRLAYFMSSTPPIHAHLDLDTDMGQRLILCHLHHGSTTKERHRMINRVTSGDQSKAWRVPFHKAVHESIYQVRQSWNVPGFMGEDQPRRGESPHEYDMRMKNLDEEIAHGWASCKIPHVSPKIIVEGSPMNPAWVALCDVLTLARSAQPKMQEVGSSAEAPPRFTGQLMLMARLRASCDLRDYINEDDVEFCRRIAQDTLSPNRKALIRLIIKEMEGVGGGMSPGDAHKAHMNMNIVENMLQHWCNMEFLEYNHTTKRYKLTDLQYNQVKLCRILDPPSVL